MKRAAPRKAAERGDTASSFSSTGPSEAAGGRRGSRPCREGGDAIATGGLRSRIERVGFSAGHRSSPHVSQPSQSLRWLPATKIWAAKVWKARGGATPEPSAFDVTLEERPDLVGEVDILIRLAEPLPNARSCLRVPQGAGRAALAFRGAPDLHA